MSEKFFTSDTHFFHKNIIKYCDRPFGDVFAMNEGIIERWNKLIEAHDDVFHLGDLSFGSPKKTAEVLERLNGRIYLVRGNHDGSKIIEHPDVSKRFEWVKDYHELRVSKKQLVVLCHFPFQVWNGSHRGSWHMHGHCHGGLKPWPVKRLDVGVDTNKMWPYSLDKISTMMGLLDVDKQHGK